MKLHLASNCHDTGLWFGKIGTISSIEDERGNSICNGTAKRCSSRWSWDCHECKETSGRLSIDVMQHEINSPLCMNYHHCHITPDHLYIFTHSDAQLRSKWTTESNETGCGRSKNWLKNPWMIGWQSHFGLDFDGCSRPNSSCSLCFHDNSVFIRCFPDFARLHLASLLRYGMLLQQVDGQIKEPRWDRAW